MLVTCRNFFGQVHARQPCVCLLGNSVCMPGFTPWNPATALHLKGIKYFTTLPKFVQVVSLSLFYNFLLPTSNPSIGSFHTLATAQRERYYLWRPSPTVQISPMHSSQAHTHTNKVSSYSLLLILIRLMPCNTSFVKRNKLQFDNHCMLVHHDIAICVST